ncbi:MAG: hypothetical protein JWN03_4535 [Nocardia sp.]|uniref:hypothetical protein n=1 Tax=Nocardia sp. TaxID=1821 RepID=UPI0026326765|nr:hypothetical protein [Nocardia sp.]MCU1644260.1 hypothetical protein [Nocardia sp.]
MLHISSRLAVVTIAALGLALTATVAAHAVPPPGTKCEGGSAVFNTNGQCVPNGSTCVLTDGVLFGWTNGDTGRCVPYDISQSY